MDIYDESGSLLGRIGDSPYPKPLSEISRAEKSRETSASDIVSRLYRKRDYDDIRGILGDAAEEIRRLREKVAALEHTISVIERSFK